MKVNIYYFILNILLIIISNIYIKEKEINLKKHIIITSIYILFTIITYTYMNSIMTNIFKLKYLNVKTYLGLLVIINLIILYNINNKTKLRYKIPSIILYILIIFILGTTLSILLGNRFKVFYIMDIKNAINLIDLSFIFFIIYLIIISLTYIISHTKKEDLLELIRITKIIIKKLVKKIKQFIKKRKRITIEELLTQYNNKALYIKGVNANIIFEDSNKENIIKNYKTLNKNINAKLTNGYTLKENKMLKNICLKLKVNNLRTIDINDENVLNSISLDEYILLKKVQES